MAGRGPHRAPQPWRHLTNTIAFPPKGIITVSDSITVYTGGMMQEIKPELPVVVIGAGPVGLAAAAQLAERGLGFVVVEAGDSVAAAIAQWGHVRLFSPWRFNTDAAARRLLATTGWTEPDPDALPTGSDLIDAYLAPLAAHPAIADRIRLRTKVVAMTRVGYDRVRTAGREAAPFLVRVTTWAGDVQDITARAVIDASGTWTNANVLGGNGLAAHGEIEHADRIVSALPDVLGKDRHRFAGRHTIVVGAGCSTWSSWRNPSQRHWSPGHCGRHHRHARTVAGRRTRCPPAARSAPGSGLWWRPG
jgi:hypothetical protein